MLVDVSYYREAPRMKVGRAGLAALLVAAGFLIAPASGATAVLTSSPKVASGLSNANTTGSTQVFNCTTLVSKPRKLNLTCDGPPTFMIDREKYPGSGGTLSKLTWASWGANSASGTGTLALSTKNADTDKISVYKRMKVTVTLNKPKTQKQARVFTQAVTTQGPGSEINTWQLKKVS